MASPATYTTGDCKRCSENFCVFSGLIIQYCAGDLSLVCNPTCETRLPRARPPDLRGLLRDQAPHRDSLSERLRVSRLVARASAGGAPPPAAARRRPVHAGDARPGRATVATVSRHQQVSPTL